MPVGPPPLILCLGFSHLSWRQWWILAGSRQEPAAPLVGGGRLSRQSATVSLCRRRMLRRYGWVLLSRSSVKSPSQRGGDCGDTPFGAVVSPGVAVGSTQQDTLNFRLKRPQALLCLQGHAGLFSMQRVPGPFTGDSAVDSMAQNRMRPNDRSRNHALQPLSLLVFPYSSPVPKGWESRQRYP